MQQPPNDAAVCVQDWHVMEMEDSVLFLHGFKARLGSMQTSARSRAGPARQPVAVRVAHLLAACIATSRDPAVLLPVAFAPESAVAEMTAAAAELDRASRRATSTCGSGGSAVLLAAAAAAAQEPKLCGCPPPTCCAAAATDAFARAAAKLCALLLAAAAGPSEWELGELVDCSPSSASPSSATPAAVDGSTTASAASNSSTDSRPWWCAPPSSTSSSATTACPCCGPPAATAPCPASCGRCCCISA